MNDHPHSRPVRRRHNFMETKMPLVTVEAIGGENLIAWKDVPVQRVPVKGEMLQMPDSNEVWEVIGVMFRYSQGLAFEPDCIIHITKVTP